MYRLQACFYSCNHLGNQYIENKCQYLYPLGASLGQHSLVYHCRKQYLAWRRLLIYITETSTAVAAAAAAADSATTAAAC